MEHLDRLNAPIRLPSNIALVMRITYPCTAIHFRQGSKYQWLVRETTISGGGGSEAIRLTAIAKESRKIQRVKAMIVLFVMPYLIAISGMPGAIMEDARGEQNV